MTQGRASHWVMRPGGPARAELRLIDYQGRIAFLKSFDHTPWWFRWSVAWWLIRREAAAYRALAGVEGVPQMYGRRRRTSLVIELVDGRSCFACAPREFEDSFFDGLHHLLERIRARGVLHGDVKRNVIRGDDGRPWLVDFGASWVMLRHLPGARRPVMALAARYDARAVAKLKALVAPHLMTDADHRAIDMRLPLESVVEACEVTLRRAAQWLAARSTTNPS